jgi:hypothetical protein
MSSKNGYVISGLRSAILINVIYSTITALIIMKLRILLSEIKQRIYLLMAALSINCLTFSDRAKSSPGFLIKYLNYNLPCILLFMIVV